jgi:cyclic pyranopterin phosphate synthase
MDPFGRVIDYLRISVTDRCNERCVYCMPEGYNGWQRRADHLSAGQVVQIVRLAGTLGFRKIRLTGGEPLLRTDLVSIAGRIAHQPGIECVGLSTNGLLLDRLAAPLRESGLRTVNISLDALDADLYHRITGGDLRRVLAGIWAAVAAGFECVKLNCVLMRGVNEHQVWPLVLFAAEHALPLRLIELMPVTTAAVLSRDQFMPIEEAMDLLRQRDELIPQPDTRIGWGPARYYRLRHSGALVGFIGAITAPHFCETCNKMRLTADGKIRPCLGDHGELDLKTAPGELGSDDRVRALLLEAIARKPKEHQFHGCYQPSRPMTAIGG